MVSYRWQPQATRLLVTLVREWTHLQQFVAAGTNIFAALMVHMGDADALVSGVTQHYADTLRPALQIIKMREDVHKMWGFTV